MKRILLVVLSVLLLSTNVYAQNQQVQVPGTGWIPAQGDASGTHYVTERYPTISSIVLLASSQSVAAGATFTSTAFMNPNGGEIWYRLLVTGTSTSTWRLKWKGSFDGATFPFLNDDVTASTEAITDTLQIISATVNVSPGQWMPLRTRSGGRITFPQIQVDFLNAVGSSGTAVVTLELLARRQ